MGNLGHKLHRALFASRSFKRLSTVTAAIALTLFFLLLFTPEIIFMLFQVEGNESAFFISRRAAMLFLGIAVFSWLGRNALDSDSRQAICIGMSVSMLALAVLGVMEFARNFVGMGILGAVVTELALGMAYFQIWNSNKKDPAKKINSAR
jgi:hypothetical protein